MDFDTRFTGLLVILLKKAKISLSYIFPGLLILENKKRHRKDFLIYGINDFLEQK